MTQTAQIVDQSFDRPSTRNKGKGPAIRRLKTKYPDLTQTQIAERVGCSRANVSAVLGRFLGKHSGDDLTDYQNEKANVYDALQFRVLGSITQSDITKAPLMARVTSAAILEDKARVIRGQATQINVSVLLDAVQAARDIQASRAAEAMAAARRRMDAERAENEAR